MSQRVASIRHCSLALTQRAIWLVAERHGWTWYARWMKAGAGKRSNRVSRTDWSIAAILAGLVLLFIWHDLAPSSLFLDDAWQALVVKTHSLREVILVSLAAPGYALLLGGWLHLTGFSELAAQLPSVLFAILLPGAAYLLARSRGLDRLAALSVSALLLSSPILLTYATHVKPYSLDAFFSLVLMAYGWSIVDLGGTPRRWLTLLTVAVLATIMSGSVAPVAGGVLLVAAAANGRADRQRRSWGFLVAGGYALFCVAWWFVFLRHAVNPSLVYFWRDFYVSTDGPVKAIGGATTALLRLMEGFTVAPMWIACPVLFLATLAAVRRDGATALLFASPVVIALAIAMLRLAPLGTGRGDVALYPAMALLVGYASNTLSRTRAVKTALTVGAGLIGLLPILLPVAVPYPQEDARPLIQMINASGAEIPVVVYGWSYWAFPLYSNRAISFVESTDPSGFGVSYSDPDVLQLARFDTPERLQHELAGFFGNADAVWFVASHFRPDWPTDFMMTCRAFEAFGYQIGERWDRPGALLVKWIRTRQLDGPLQLDSLSTPACVALAPAATRAGPTLGTAAPTSAITRLRKSPKAKTGVPTNRPIASETPTWCRNRDSRTTSRALRANQQPPPPPLHTGQPGVAPLLG